LNLIRVMPAKGQDISVPGSIAFARSAPVGQTAVGQYAAAATNSF
jgi:hypothetical protein